MLVSWLGEAGIRLQFKDCIVVIDPPAPSTGFGPSRQASTVVALTENANRDAKSIGGDPLVITTPGEFERQAVFIYGLHLAPDAGRIHWRVEGEELSFGHLGSLDHKLDNGELAQLEGVDVLFVPVGGKSVLTAEQAAELVSQIEPRIVIPIQYHVTGSTMHYDGVEKFLREFGSKAKAAEPQAKAKILKKDLPAEETQVIVLTLE